MAYLLFALVIVYHVLGIALLLCPAAHQVSPLVENALQARLGQPLTGALEDGTMLVLPLGSPLPALTPQCGHRGDVVFEWSLGKSQIQFLHIEFEIQELKNAQIECSKPTSAVTRQSRQHSDVVSEWSFGKFQMACLLVVFG